jgi:hypothetical protein
MYSLRALPVLALPRHGRIRNHVADPRLAFRVVVTEAETLQRGLCERHVDLVIIKRVRPFSEEQFTFETLFFDSYVVVGIGMLLPWPAAADNWPAPPRVTWVPQPSPATMQHSKKRRAPASVRSPPTTYSATSRTPGAT